MNYFLFISAFFILLFSCKSEENHALCDCVKAGEVVNELSASLLERTYSASAKDSLDEAIIYRDKLCDTFQFMPSHALMKAKESCKQLNNY